MLAVMAILYDSIQWYHMTLFCFLLLLLLLVSRYSKFSPSTNKTVQAWRIHELSRFPEWQIYILKSHDDVIKWKYFPRYWPLVQGINRSPVNSPHKGQWRGALMFSLICAWLNGWVNNGEAGDLIHHRAHYDVTVMVHLSLYYGHNAVGHCGHYICS